MATEKITSQLALVLPQETIVKVEKANLELLVPKATVTKISIPDNAFPDTVGIMVGKMDINTGNLISNLDKEGTALLEKYIENGIVVTKTFSQMNKEHTNLVNVPHYFVIYDVLESSVNRPTYTEDSISGYMLDGHYEIEYELLLASEGYTRRMVVKTSSINIPLWELFHDLIENIEENAEDEDEIANQFYKNEDDEICFTMFDSIGNPTEIVLDADEFGAMIVGFRQLSCTFVEDEE